METSTMKRKVLDNHLPPAACTTDMLEQIKTIASREQTSASAVMRHAIALFLERENSKSSQKLDKQVISEAV